MEELLNAWKSYDAKLDHSLSLNRAMLKEMKLDKTKNKMQRALVARSMEAGVFGFLMIALWIFVFNRLANPEFVLAAGVLLVFCVIGLIGNIRQIVLITHIDYTDSVVSIQKKIEQIAVHHLQLIRLAMLSIPFYTAYIIIGFELFFGVNIYTQGNLNWWIGQLVFSTAMVPVTVWLYGKIDFKHIHIKWVKTLIASLGGQSLTKALHFLKEIETFEEK